MWELAVWGFRAKFEILLWPSPPRMNEHCVWSKETAPTMRSAIMKLALNVYCCMADKTSCWTKRKKCQRVKWRVFGLSRIKGCTQKKKFKPAPITCSAPIRHRASLHLYKPNVCFPIVNRFDLPGLQVSGTSLQHWALCFFLAWPTLRNVTPWRESVTIRELLITSFPI